MRPSFLCACKTPRRWLTKESPFCQCAMVKFCVSCRLCVRSGRAPGPSHLEAGDREQALAVADLDHVVVGVVEEELRAGTRGGAVSSRARDVRPPARVRTCCTLAGPSRMISLTYLMPQCLRRSSTSAIELHWNERWSARGSISAARRTGCPWMRCTPMPYPNSLFAPPRKCRRRQRLHDTARGRGRGRRGTHQEPSKSKLGGRFTSRNPRTSR